MAKFEIGDKVRLITPKKSNWDANNCYLGIPIRYYDTSKTFTISFCSEKYAYLEEDTKKYLWPLNCIKKEFNTLL